MVFQVFVKALVYLAMGGLALLLALLTVFLITIPLIPIL